MLQIKKNDSSINVNLNLR